MNVLDLLAPAMRSNGLRVIVSDDKFVSLTKIWRSQGSPPNRDPRQWRRRDGQGFIEWLAGDMRRPVITTKRGGTGGGGDTQAHWQVAAAYSAYLSHELHRKMNEVVFGQLVR